MNQRIRAIPIVHTQYINIDINRDVLLCFTIPRSSIGQKLIFEFCHPSGAMWTKRGVTPCTNRAYCLCLIKNIEDNNTFFSDNDTLTEL